MNGDNTVSQSENQRPEEGRKRSPDEQGTLIHSGQNTPLRYFSMFTGVGGFELGLEKASSQRDKESRTDSPMPNGEPSAQGGSERSFDCIGFSEIDKYANQLLATKWPNIKNYGDATKIDPKELPNFDMLCGGVPCQSWSIAGKRKGFEDIRGTMWFEVFRIANAKRPKYLLLENVKGLLSHDGGRSFERIAEMICEMGYVIDFTVLNSKYFGVPQNRERVFILAIREDMIPKEKVL